MVRCFGYPSTVRRRRGYRTPTRSKCIEDRLFGAIRHGPSSCPQGTLRGHEALLCHYQPDSSVGFSAVVRILAGCPELLFARFPVSVHGARPKETTCFLARCLSRRLHGRKTTDAWGHIARANAGVPSGCTNLHRDTVGLTSRSSRSLRLLGARYRAPAYRHVTNVRSCGIYDLRRKPGNGVFRPVPGHSEETAQITYSDDRFRPLSRHSA